MSVLDCTFGPNWPLLMIGYTLHIGRWFVGWFPSFSMLIVKELFGQKQFKYIDSCVFFFLLLYDISVLCLICRKFEHHVSSTTIFFIPVIHHHLMLVDHSDLTTNPAVREEVRNPKGPEQTAGQKKCSSQYCID